MFRGLFGSKQSQSDDKKNQVVVPTDEIKTTVRPRPLNEEEKNELRRRIDESAEKIRIKLELAREEEERERERKIEAEEMERERLELAREEEEREIERLELAREKGEKEREKIQERMRIIQTQPLQIDLGFSYKIFKYMTILYKNESQFEVDNEDDKQFYSFLRSLYETFKNIEKGTSIDNSYYNQYINQYKEKFTENLNKDTEQFMLTLSLIFNRLILNYNKLKLTDDINDSLIIQILKYPNDKNNINYKTFKDYKTISFNNGQKDEVVKYDLSRFNELLTYKFNIETPVPILPFLYEIFISFYINDKKENFTITLSNETPVTPVTPVTGGKKINKKEILGKVRCIYKKTGDRKEYIKHKGELITVSEYKKMMRDKKKNVVTAKPKAKPKPKAKAKPKSRK
jgi:hypothetical protein